MKTILLVCALLLAFAHSPRASSPSQQAAGSSDAAFVQQAARGGKTVVELSKLAAASASSPAVRAFAQAMLDEQTRTNKDLAMIAARENISVLGDLDSEHAQLRDDLAGMHGTTFDRTYVHAMQEDQQKMADLMKSSGAVVSADELRIYMQQTLPVIQEHLRMARDLDIQ